MCDRCIYKDDYDNNVLLIYRWWWCQVRYRLVLGIGWPIDIQMMIMMIIIDRYIEYDDDAHNRYLDDVRWIYRYRWWWFWWPLHIFLDNNDDNIQ